MKPKDPFLAQIAANPDDDALRLVYADWLEERGDPRCELIRLEAEMAHLPAYSGVKTGACGLRISIKKTPPSIS